jgi:outer membrane protein assembly factor BamC
MEGSMSFKTDMTIMNFARRAFSRFAFYSTLAVISFVLSGCGFFYGDDGIFRNRSTTYSKADNIPPLVLPPGKHSESMGELYPIPPITESDFGYDALEGDYEVPRPMPISANLEQENVKIQRVGGESWILLNVAPGEVWPRIRNFLNVNELTVSRADIGKGIIETNWIQFKTDLNSYDRYRIQIDQGVQPETSEVHIVHMSIPVADVSKPSPAWPAKSMNAEREQWLLDELAATLASDVSGGATSLLAQNIGGAVKAKLEMVRGEPVLTIKLDRSRSLATLSFAAKQDGFTTFESDSAAGLFYVQYINPEDSKPGWLKRLFRIGLNPKPPTSPYSLAQIKTNMLTGADFDNAPASNRKKEKELRKAPGYLLVMSEAGSDFQVRIRDPYGKRLTNQEARELMTILRKNLI